MKSSYVLVFALLGIAACAHKSGSIRSRTANASSASSSALSYSDRSPSTNQPGKITSSSMRMGNETRFLASVDGTPAAAFIPGNGEIEVRGMTIGENLYELSVKGNEAKKLYSIFGKTEFTMPESMESIQCNSETSCRVMVHADMLSKDYCTQVSCGEKATNYGLDLSAVQFSLKRDQDRAIYSPAQKEYNWIVGRHVLEFKKLYERMAASKSRYVTAKEFDVSRELQFKSNQMAFTCREYKNPKMEEPMDIFAARKADKKPFLNSHTCAFVFFTQLKKMKATTFQIDPKGLEVKVSLLKGGRLVPIPNVALTLGGDFGQFFRHGGIYRAPAVKTDSHGTVKFSQFNYFYDDILPATTKVPLQLMTPPDMKKPFASTLAQYQISSCQPLEEGWTQVFYLDERGKYTSEGATDSIAKKLDAKFKGLNRTAMSYQLPSRQKIHIVIAGNGSYDEHNKIYKPTDMDEVLVNYKRVCKKVARN